MLLFLVRVALGDDNESVLDQHVGGGICVDVSGMDKILEIHGELLSYFRFHERRRRVSLRRL